jgi:hypothetical protein
MSSIAAQYVIDNEQERGKYRRFNSKGKITGLALVTREFIPITETPVIKERGIKYKPITDELESLKAEILIPHLSRKGKARFEESFLFEDQYLDISFDHIKREKVQKYLATGEVFTVPKSGSVARITVTGIPSEYSALELLANIDKMLGFPDYLAEKPYH